MRILNVFTLFAFLTVLSSSLSAGAALRGKVKIDGSSTVFPITEAIAEEFQKSNPRVRVQVGVSGTGGGFKKFVKNKIDINDASRRIKSSETEKAKTNGVDYLELEVAYDGISVVVNPENTWAKDLSTADLKKIWSPDSKVKLWSDIRADFPKEEIKLYGPGAESGTFDYFTKAINGKSRASRAGYTKSEDDNVLVKGVAGNKYAMGYFGFAYYEANRDKVKAIKINGVYPTRETINKSTYVPLARPVYIYVSKKSSMREEVKAFVNFYLKEAGKITSEVGYVSLPPEKYQEQIKMYQEFVK